jgi:hypothetical protein
MTGLLKVHGDQARDVRTETAVLRGGSGLRLLQKREVDADSGDFFVCFHFRFRSLSFQLSAILTKKLETVNKKN